MNDEEKAFPLASLMVGDVLTLQGDDFDVVLCVVRAGETPGCIMQDADFATPIEHIQLIGHMPYQRMCFWEHLTVGMIDDSGQVVYARRGTNGTVDIVQRSLVNITVKRDEETLYHKEGA